MKVIKRNTIINNVKSLLIFCMVLGHLMQRKFCNYLTAYEVIYSYIYWFHMPAFIFISGYLSKNKKNLKKFFTLFILYIVFNTLYGIIIGNNINPLIPNWYMWYIINLFFWKITTLLLEKTKCTISIIVSIMLSLLFRILPNIEILALSRLFIFYPYFVIGYYFTKNKLNLLLNKKYRLVSFISIILLTIINYYCIICFSCFPKILYRKGLNIIFTNLYYKLFLVFFIEIITVIVIFSIFNIMYRKKNKVLNRISQNSIVIYLFHAYIIYLLNFKYINNIFEIIIITIDIVLLLSCINLHSIYNCFKNSKK